MGIIRTHWTPHLQCNPVNCAHICTQAMRGSGNELSQDRPSPGSHGAAADPHLKGSSFCFSLKRSVVADSQTPMTCRCPFLASMLTMSSLDHKRLQRASAGYQDWRRCQCQSLNMHVPLTSQLCFPDDTVHSPSTQCRSWRRSSFANPTLLAAYSQACRLSLKM